MNMLKASSFFNANRIRHGAANILGDFRKSNKPIDIIIDTDIGNDIDDVLAFGLLAALQKDSIVCVRAVLISNGNRNAGEYCQSLLGHFGIECPIYCNDKAPVGVDGKYLFLHQKFSYLKDRARNPIKRRFDEYLLKWIPLSEIIMIGFSTNIASLIALKYSNDGQPIIRNVYIMAGNFKYRNAEYNIRSDPKSYKILNNSPVEKHYVDFSIGEDVSFDGEIVYALQRNKINDIVIESYCSFKRAAYDRPLWDPCTIMAAVTKPETLFSWARGNVLCDDSLITRFFDDEEGDSLRAQLNSGTSFLLKKLMRECCFGVYQNLSID